MCVWLYMIWYIDLSKDIHWQIVMLYSIINRNPIHFQKIVKDCQKKVSTVASIIVSDVYSCMIVGAGEQWTKQIFVCDIVRNPSSILLMLCVCAFNVLLIIKIKPSRFYAKVCPQFQWSDANLSSMPRNVGWKISFHVGSVIVLAWQDQQ